MLVLSRKINNSIPNGFGSYLILGRRGIGKTSYALKSLHEAFVTQGYNDTKAWIMSLDCLKFSIKDVVEYLEDAVAKDEIKPALVWDDIRVHASGIEYHRQRDMVAKLGGLLDTVRTLTNNLLMTCPSSKGLLGVLQSYDDYQIRIHYNPEGSGFDRLSKGYMWNTLPSGSRRIYLKYHDRYSCRLPNWIYRKYMVRRKKATENALREVKETLEN